MDKGLDSEYVAQSSDLPEGVIPAMMLALGYPGKDSKRSAWHRKRSPMDSFAFELWVLVITL